VCVCVCVCVCVGYYNKSFVLSLMTKCQMLQRVINAFVGF
jgi:hypothetical protein